MKRFTITGKKVFRDNQEGVFYVLLNDNTTMIQVENNPEDMAVLAWNQSTQAHKVDYCMMNKFDIHWALTQFNELPQTMKDHLINYQKSKMEIKA